MSWSVPAVVASDAADLARDIHHLEPVHATGRAASANPALLQALCERCHRDAHALTRFTEPGRLHPD
jgi:hypothetical protein